MLLIGATLLVSALVALYLYLTWNYSYWKKRDVPGPVPSIPGLGNFPSFLLGKQPFVEEIDEIYRNYKAKFNFVGVFSNRSPRILVTSASLAKDILTKNFKEFHDNEFGELTNKELDPIFGRNPFMLNGEEWKAKRAEITPAFTASRMKALYSLIEDVGENMTKFIQDNRGSSLEAKELAAKYTTNVVSSCIFTTDAKSFENEKSEIREMGRAIIEPSLLSLIPFLCPSLAKLFNLGILPKSVNNFFINLMKEAIRYREANDVKRVDYLDHLIGLRNKTEISELDMAAHGVTFFIDGSETSSIAMAFILYEIAKNTDVQTRLREELQNATSEDGKITYEALLELPYLDQVINEGLRLWPPASFISKKCTIPIELDLTDNRKVPIGTDICAIISPWSLHRDPEYYDDPLTFNPDRFSPETGGTNPYREKGCYIPFGEGPRQCLGMRFARMQTKQGIYEVIKNFEICVNPKTRDPMVLDPKQFLTMPLGGIWLDFEPIIM